MVKRGPIKFIWGLTRKLKNGIMHTKGGFKTQREAKAAARLVEFQKENGTFIKESNMPFETIR